MWSWKIKSARWSPIPFAYMQCPFANRLSLHIDSTVLYSNRLLLARCCSMSSDAALHSFNKNGSWNNWGRSEGNEEVYRPMGQTKWLSGILALQSVSYKYILETSSFWFLCSLTIALSPAKTKTRHSFPGSIQYNFNISLLPSSRVVIIGNAY